MSACVVKPESSRMCERGTLCCVVRHGARGVVGTLSARPTPARVPNPERDARIAVRRRERAALARRIAALADPPHGYDALVTVTSFPGHEFDGGRPWTARVHVPGGHDVSEHARSRVGALRRLLRAMERGR